MPWRRRRQTTPGFLPGEFHGQEKPGWLQSMWSQVGHDLATKLLSSDVLGEEAKFFFFFKKVVT